ncbi:MAG: VOC family protein [Gammaproteobacteria bacterium]|nr:VOC family protein [Gammaproteobacteria bacterium]
MIEPGKNGRRSGSVAKGRCEAGCSAKNGRPLVRWILTPGRTYPRSPQAAGGANTQALCVFVDDVDAHCEHAREAGAAITTEPATQDYGEGYWTERTYAARDPEGHHWWFLQRL